MSASRMMDPLRRLQGKAFCCPSSFLIVSMREKKQARKSAMEERSKEFKYRPHEDQVLFEAGKLAERWLLRYDDLKITKRIEQLAVYESDIMRVGRCLEFWKFNILKNSGHGSWADIFLDFFSNFPEIAKELYHQLYPIVGGSSSFEESFSKILQIVLLAHQKKSTVRPDIVDEGSNDHYVLAMAKLMANTANARNSMAHRGLDMSRHRSLNFSAFSELGVRCDPGLVFHLMERVAEATSARWIDEARQKEKSGLVEAARALILELCQAEPSNEDAWLESLRLCSPNESDDQMNKALQKTYSSVRIWLKAAELKPDVEGKRDVFSQALTVIQTSALLWKRASELEEPDKARAHLTEAVKHCPYSAELWIALSEFETYHNAKRTLNQAFECSGGDRFMICVALAKLEETVANFHLVNVVIERSIALLAAVGLNISRKSWLDEAVHLEKAGFVVTCRAIVRSIIPTDGSVAKMKYTWLMDAEMFEACGAFECARATYAYALTSYPTSRTIWEKSALLEQKFGSQKSLQILLRDAVSHRPDVENLWLMLVRSQISENDVVGARSTVTSALKAIEKHPVGEELHLLAAELEPVGGRP